MKKIRLYIIFVLLIFVQNICFAGVEAYNPGAIRSEIKEEMYEDSLDRELITKPNYADKKKKKQQDIINEIEETSTDGDYNPRFKLNKIIFEGNTVYKHKELEKFVEPLVGLNIQIDEVLKIAEVVTKKYNYDGYITSYAYIPEQDVIDGVIKIQVVESRIKDIQIENNKWERDFYFNHVLFSANGVRKGKVFNVNELDSIMKDVNNMDYLKTSFTAIRDKETNETILKVYVKDRAPVTFNVAWDNHGRYYTGEQRARLTLTNNNLTGMGDKLYGGVVLANGTTGVLSGYQIPVSPWGTKLAFDYGYTNIKMGKELSDLNLRGKSTNYTLRLIQPIIKKSNTELEASVGLDWSNTSSQARGVKLTDYSLTVLRAAIYGTHDDKMGRTFASINGDFGLNTSHSKKVDALGAPDTIFQKYSAHVIRLQRIPLKNSYLVVRVGGQYSPTPLYPSEQMQLGGYHSVRGYESGVVLGDYGVNGTIELRTPVPFIEALLPKKHENISNNIKLLAFYDWGYFGAHQNPYGYNVSFIHSVGAGLNIFLRNGISLNLAAGIPLVAKEYQSGSVRFHFALSTDVDRLIYHKFEKETL